MYGRIRSLGALIAANCLQLLAFLLSRAAQHQNPGLEEIKELCVALQIQKDNPEAGLKYINVELNKNLGVYAWIDGSLANNRDLISQIGFFIAIGNDKPEKFAFRFRGNVIHWSSTKM